MLIVWWYLPSVLGITEVDSLQPLHDTLAPRGFELLALSLDKPEDDSLVWQFATTHGWRCGVLLDSARTAATAYGLSHIPTAILVSMDTTIVYTLHGYCEGDREAVRMQVLQWLP